MPTRVIIKTWWVNRAAAYLLAGPAPMFVLSVVNKSLKEAIIGFSFALFIEIFFLNFRIEIDDEALFYWKYPRIIAAPTVVMARSIEGIESTYLDAKKSIKTASIIIYVKRDGASVHKQIMHLAGFSLGDINYIVKWVEGNILRAC